VLLITPSSCLARFQPMIPSVFGLMKPGPPNCENYFKPDAARTHIVCTNAYL